MIDVVTTHITADILRNEIIPNSKQKESGYTQKETEAINQTVIKIAYALKEHFKANHESNKFDSEIWFNAINERIEEWNKKHE